MKITRKTASRILWCEGLGFTLLIILSWLDEFHESWHESAVESAAVAAVWILVHFFTRRLLRHLHYLEGFLMVCAWCRKIKLEQDWVPLERYFSEGLSTRTSHGMCPECARQVRIELEAEGPPDGGPAGA